jgi:hypothetical protein
VRKFVYAVRTSSCRSWPASRLSKRLADKHKQLRTGWKTRIPHPSQFDDGRKLDYGYGVNFQEAYRNVTNGDINAIEQTSIGVTDGLFGPMLQPAHGHLRPFVTLKGGFIDFRLSPSLIPYSSVVSTVLPIRTSSVSAALIQAVAQ